MERHGASDALVQMSAVASGGSGTVVDFDCVDCAEQAGRVAAAGGQLTCGKMAIGDFGVIALASDAGRNTFGLHSMA